MTTRDGRPSVPYRLLALERRYAEALRPGCPHCRDGYGFRVVVLSHGEPFPAFDKRCGACGRAFREDEGGTMVIKEIDPAELARLGVERDAALRSMRERHVSVSEGSR